MPVLDGVWELERKVISLQGSEPWRVILRGIRLADGGQLLTADDGRAAGTWRRVDVDLVLLVGDDRYEFPGVFDGASRETITGGALVAEVASGALAGTVDARLVCRPAEPGVLDATIFPRGSWDLRGQNHARPARRVRLKEGGRLIGAVARAGQRALSGWRVVRGVLELTDDDGVVAVFDRVRQDAELGWFEISGTSPEGWLTLSRGNLFSGDEEVIAAHRHLLPAGSEAHLASTGVKFPERATLSNDGRVVFVDDELAPLSWTIRHGGLVLYSPAGAESWRGLPGGRSELPLPFQLPMISLSRTRAPRTGVLYEHVELAGESTCPSSVLGVMVTLRGPEHCRATSEQRAAQARASAAVPSAAEATLAPLDDADFQARFRRRRVWVGASGVRYIDDDGNVWAARKPHRPDDGVSDMRQVTRATEHGRAVGLALETAVLDDGGLLLLSGEQPRRLPFTDIAQGPVGSFGVCLRRDGRVGSIGSPWSDKAWWQDIDGLPPIMTLTQSSSQPFAFATARDGHAWSLSTKGAHTELQSESPAWVVTNGTKLHHRVWFCRDGTIRARGQPLEIAKGTPLQTAIDVTCGAGLVLVLDDEAQLWALGSLGPAIYKTLRRLDVGACVGLAASDHAPAAFLDDRGWIWTMSYFVGLTRTPNAVGPPPVVSESWLPATDETQHERDQFAQHLRATKRYTRN